MHSVNSFNAQDGNEEWNGKRGPTVISRRIIIISALVTGLILVALSRGSFANKGIEAGKHIAMKMSALQDNAPAAPATVVQLDAAHYDALVSNILQKGCPTLVRTQTNIVMQYPRTVKCEVDAAAQKITLVSRQENRQTVKLLEVVVDKASNTRTMTSMNYNTANEFLSDDSATMNHHTTGFEAAWNGQQVANPSPQPWEWGNAKACPSQIGFERSGSVTIYPSFPVTCYAHITTQGNFMIGLMNVDRSQDTMEVVINPGYAGNGGIQCARVFIPPNGVVSTATNPNTYLNGLNGGDVITGLAGSPRCSFTDIRFYQ